jgi:hypothetical protein
VGARMALQLEPPIDDSKITRKTQDGKMVCFHTVNDTSSLLFSVLLSLGLILVDVSYFYLILIVFDFMILVKV